jgi:hypothetical protein
VLTTGRQRQDLEKQEVYSSCVLLLSHLAFCRAVGAQIAVFGFIRDGIHSAKHCSAVETAVPVVSVESGV